MVQSIIMSTTTITELSGILNDPKALILIHSHALVAHTLILKLQKLNTIVHTKPHKHTYYDYLLIIGGNNNSSKYLNLLKDQGKALWIKKSTFEEKNNKKNTSSIEIFTIEADKRYQTRILVKNILKKLFISPPRNNPYFIRQINAKKKKMNKMPKNKKHIPLYKIIFAISALILLPYLFIAISSILSIFQIGRISSSL